MEVGDKFWHKDEVESTLGSSIWFRDTEGGFWSVNVLDCIPDHPMLLKIGLWLDRYPDGIKSLIASLNGDDVDDPISLRELLFVLRKQSTMKVG